MTQVWTWLLVGQELGMEHRFICRLLERSSPLSTADVYCILYFSSSGDRILLNLSHCVLHSILLDRPQSLSKRSRQTNPPARQNLNAFRSCFRRVPSSPIYLSLYTILCLFIVFPKEPEIEHHAQGCQGVYSFSLLAAIYCANLLAPQFWC